MKEIPLTRGMVALVSDHWFEFLSQWKWHASKKPNTWYAKRMEGKSPHQKAVLMHRVVTRAPAGMDVDHLDGNGLNNQDGNLRVCTHAQNMANVKKNRTNRSGYKGVSWDKRRQKWRATIYFNYHTIFLGNFDDPIKAALRYDAKARELFGEYARTNF